MLPEDAELREKMRAYQGGSMEAFEQLYAVTAPALLGYLRK